MNARINGLDYHIEITGEGHPLLLLHGFTGSSGTWQSFFERWGAHSTLICPDLPGHGRTTPIPEPERLSMENTVEDLKCILDDFKIEKADVLGYSMGGRVALAFALRFPERVRNLILESSSPGLENPDDRKARRMKDNQLANFIKEDGIEEFVDYWENIPLFSSLQSLSNEITLKVRKERLRNSPEGLASSLVGIGTGVQPSYWNKLEELNCRTLLIAGSKDEKYCKIAKEMAARIKNCRIELVYEAGHAIHVEQSEKFGTIVSGFLTNT
jgi:2-succinyl-6-hydroxy-2,4-cyclohexadiene-1-carboxylate synthase